MKVPDWLTVTTHPKEPGADSANVTVQIATCIECGKAYTYRPCGFTHTMVTAELLRAIGYTGGAA